MLSTRALSVDSATVGHAGRDTSEDASDDAVLEKVSLRRKAVSRTKGCVAKGEPQRKRYQNSSPEAKVATRKVCNGSAVLRMWLVLGE